MSAEVRIHPLDLFEILKTRNDLLSLPFGDGWIEVDGVRYVEDKTVRVANEQRPSTSL